MKRWIALCLCLALALPLCACGRRADVPLKIGDTAFSSGVFAYLLQQEMNEADADAAREELLEAAVGRCAVFAALETLLKQEGVTLSVPLKSEVASRVQGMWQFFGAHYRALGMEKPDLTRLLTWEAEKKALTAHDFGAGGKNEVSEKKLKRTFTETYVGYRGFSQALTKQNAKGETVPLTDDERTELRGRFKEMRKRAAAGTSIDSLYKEFSKEKGLLVTADIDVVVVKAGDPTVTEAFFAAVAALKSDETAVLENGTQLYLLQKTDLTADDAPYFAQVRDDILLALKLPVVEKKLLSLADPAAAVVDARVCDEIYARVRAAANAVAAAPSAV